MKLSNEMRLFLLGVAGACVLAIGITIVVVGVGNSRTAPQPAQKVDLAGSLSGLDLSDFQIPDSYVEVWKQSWHPSRAQEKQWTWEEVQHFWLDPRKSALASISEENDKKIGELFKGVQ